MKTFTLNKKEVNIPESWTDVSFNQFVEFTKLIKTQKSEESIVQQYSEYEPHIQDLYINLYNIEFNTKILCFWTGLDEHDVSVCDMDYIANVMSTLGFVALEYEPIALKSFIFKGETYNLPSGGFEKENFGNYIESEQISINNKLIESGNFDILPRQMAILCKKEGEVSGLIDDNLVNEREALFRQLDMATIWDAAFFLLKQESLLTRSFLTYLEEQNQMLKPGSQQKELLTDTAG